MITLSAFDSPLFRALGWALMHFVWQGALVSLLLVTALTLIPRRAALARYGAACAAMALLALAPVATTIAMLRAGSDSPAAAAATEETLTVGDAWLALGPAELAEAGITQAALRHQSPETITTIDSNGNASWQLHLERALPWIVSLWMLGVSLMAARLLGGLGRIGHMRRTAQSAPEEWRDRLARLSGQIGLSKAVALLVSSRVAAPVTFGWLRPVILMPASAVTGLPPAHLEMILAHELAHIRRHDYLINLIQAAVEAALFYHPAVWWVSARVREEREHCCDDLAIEISGGSPAAYVSALTALEECRLGPLALAAANGSLLARARRLLGQDDGRDPWAASSARWLAGGALLLMLGAGGLLLPSQANERDAAADPSAIITAEPADDLSENSVDGNTTSGKENLVHPLFDEVAIVAYSDGMIFDQSLDHDVRSITAVSQPGVTYWISAAPSEDMLNTLKNYREVTYYLAFTCFSSDKMAQTYLQELRNKGFVNLELEPRGEMLWIVMKAGDSFSDAMDLAESLQREGLDSNGFMIKGEDKVSVTTERGNAKHTILADRFNLTTSPGEVQAVWFNSPTPPVNESIDPTVWEQASIWAAVGPVNTCAEADEVRNRLAMNGFLVENIELLADDKNYALINVPQDSHAIELLSNDLSQIGMKVSAWKTSARRRDARMKFYSAANQQLDVIRLVVENGGSLMLDGAEMTWDELPGKLEGVPNRERTIFVFTIADADMTMREATEALQRAEELSKKFGFQEFVVKGIRSPNSKNSDESESQREKQNVEFDQRVIAGSVPAAPEAPNAPVPPMPPVKPANPLPAVPDKKRMKYEMTTEQRAELEKRIEEIEKQINKWMESQDWKKIEQEMEALAESLPMQMNEIMEKVQRDLDNLMEKMANDPQMKEMMKYSLDEVKREIEAKVRGNFEKHGLSAEPPSRQPLSEATREPETLDLINLDLHFKKVNLQTIAEVMTYQTGVKIAAMGNAAKSSVDIDAKAMTPRAILDLLVQTDDWFWQWNAADNQIEIWDRASWNKVQGSTKAATEKKLASTLVTLDYSRSPVIDVLRSIAQSHELNVIFRESDVQGEVTVSVKDVPLSTALGSILKTNGLDYVIEDGGIIRIIERQ